MFTRGVWNEKLPMQIILAWLLALLLAGDAYARAGGGGGYRSGSSGSSRSSSSSSSSRSSYSGSSSSSSYRSSGSSSRSSGGSGSYAGYSGPTYSTLSDLASIRREFDFGTPGRITIKETITFKYTGLSTSGHEYTPATPNGPWSISTGPVYDITLIAMVDIPKEYFRFKLRNPVVGKEYTLSFSYTVAASATPTATGAMYEFFPYCKVTDCQQKFLNLPEGSYMDFYEQERHTGTPAKHLKRRNDRNFNLAYADLKGVRFFRLNATDQAHRHAALSAWAQSELATKQKIAIKIMPDGTVREEIDLEYAKDQTYKVLMTANAGKRQYFRRVENIGFAAFSAYSDSFLAIKNPGKTVAFEVLGFAQGPGSLRIPLGAVTTSGYDATKTQYKHKFINQYELIKLELPANFKAEPTLWECKEYAYEKCEILRPVAARIEARSNGIVLEPLEAQVSGLWLLDLKLAAGAFTDPSLWTEVKFGWGHYHEFGDYPQWVFWFYLLAILTGLITLIVVFTTLKRAVVRRMKSRQHAEAEEKAIGDIIKRDPHFDVAAFKARGREIATRIQDAWMAGDMRPVRRFLSQGVYNRFRLQLRIMRDFEKRQNAMADFRIEEFYVAKRRKTGEFDCLVVRMEAEARDLMVSTDKTPVEALALARKAPRTQFVEYYSFMRRRNAQTREGLSVDQCSKCGTPFIAEGETNKCKSCGAVMGAGEFDWVLAEITQEVEYREHARGSKVAGEMSSDRIEDRASFVFWRDIMARITGDASFVARDATDDYLRQLIPTEMLRDVAVGAADLEHYDDSLTPLEAKVRIKWSASLNRSAVQHRESVLTLRANPSEETGSGFAEHGCESCGGPLPETDAETCAYCRSPIQRKNHDWLLHTIETTVE